jgi:hypothetical protein
MQKLSAFLLWLALFVSAPVLATSQYDTMTAAVTFTDVITALLAVGAVLLGVVIVIKGISWIIQMVKHK